MAALLTPFPKFRAFDANGNPLAGGKLYTYEAGTTTPKATYTDAGGLAANANPVILNANGEANVWLLGTYKFRLDSALDVTQWTVDNLGGAAVPSGYTISKVTGAVVASNGAATLTLSPAPFVPAARLLLGVVVQVTTTFGNGNGLTGLHIGDGGIVDRWFTNLPRTAGAPQASNLAVESGSAGMTVIVTAVGGLFDATGGLTVSAYYLTLEI